VRAEYASVVEGSAAATAATTPGQVLVDLAVKATSSLTRPMRNLAAGLREVVYEKNEARHVRTGTLLVDVRASPSAAVGCGLGGWSTAAPTARSTQTTPAPAGPLTGLRVLDLGTAGQDPGGVAGGDKHAGNATMIATSCCRAH
jgi:uncharacterized ferredoxin-like protein